MLGEKAPKYPELVQRVAQAGHASGYHSWDHPVFPVITPRERRAQICACAKGIALYGQGLFRARWLPGQASRLDALWLVFRGFTWNVVEEGARSTSTHAASLRIQLHVARMQSELKSVVRLIFDEEWRNLVLKKDWMDE